MKLFSMFKKNVISIDLGSYETKVVKGIKKKDGIKIDKAFSFNVPDSVYKNGYIINSTVLTETVRNELKKNNIGSGNCFLSIKSTDIITREISFPVINPKEIEGMLKYQLPEHLPMDYSKYIIQNKIIEKYMEQEKEKLNVLVVAIPAEIVDMHYDFVKELNLKPIILDYQPNCVWKLLNFSKIINKEVDLSEKIVAAIDLGYESTNVTIIDKGKIKLTRIIDMGGITVDNNTETLINIEKEEIYDMNYDINDNSILEEGFSDYNRYLNITKTCLESIISGIDRIFKFYYSKYVSNEIDIVILYGGMSNIKGVNELFFNYFGIPVLILDSLEKINPIKDLSKYINCAGSLIRDDEV